MCRLWTFCCAAACPLAASPSCAAPVVSVRIPFTRHLPDPMHRAASFLQREDLRSTHCHARCHMPKWSCPPPPPPPGQEKRRCASSSQLLQLHPTAPSRTHRCGQLLLGFSHSSWNVAMGISSGIPASSWTEFCLWLLQLDTCGMTVQAGTAVYFDTERKFSGAFGCLLPCCHADPHSVAYSRCRSTAFT